jgi:hypothetical protein
MENEQHIKSLSTGGKNRLRFSSTRKRSKIASADIYRSYKRRIGVTTAASREERVHHPHQDENRKKRQRTSAEDAERVAVLGQAGSSDSDIDTESTFASELDLAYDRNASEIFAEFHREIWHLVRSLPEVLHHASQIIDILMSYMLSPESNPSERSTIFAQVSGGDRLTYVTNHATTDILHLVAVLARDLRHEIHPYVHSQILSRIVYDLLNPPVPPPELGRQPPPMSVTAVEAAFRTLSYIFRYDSELLLSEVDKEGQEPCLEKMRQYYGATLGHKRDYVRRLAAESFSPMIRKLKADSARRRHIRRILRALAASAQRSDNEPLPHSLKRAQSDAVDGVAFLLFETARGMSGRLHSKGHQVISCVLDCLTSESKKGGVEMIHLVTCRKDLRPFEQRALCGSLGRDIPSGNEDFIRLGIFCGRRVAHECFVLHPGIDRPDCIVQALHIHSQARQQRMYGPSRRMCQSLGWTPAEAARSSNVSPIISTVTEARTESFMCVLENTPR